MKIKSISSILLIFCLFFPYISKAEEQVIKEYGVVILPSEPCVQKITPVFDDISLKFKSEKAQRFSPHITLFRGAFRESELPNIQEDLAMIKIPNNTVLLSDISTTLGRVIRYDIKDELILPRLHDLVAHISVQYKARPLEIVMAEYDKLNEEQKKQVDKYGTYGIFKKFKPGLGIFRLSKPDSKLDKKIEQILQKAPKDFVCEISSLAIGETDYSGNLTKILYEFKINKPEKK